jgi:hypothetical protein
MWYVHPFNFLRHRGGLELEEKWDGGFISIMIGSALMERYFRRKTGTHHGLSKNEKIRLGVLATYDTDFKNSAADTLGIPRINIVDFYSVFRNGVMHQGMPRQITLKDGAGNVTAIYDYKIQAGLSALPERKQDGIKIRLSMDPWAFTQTMIDLFLADQAAIDAEFDHGLAEIFSEDADSTI